MRHQVVLGTELGTTMRDDFSVQGNATSIDIFDPVYGLPQPTPDRPRTEASDFGRYGVYLQDLISFAPRWKFLAGLRHDWVDSRSLDTQAGPDPVSESQTSLNPRFGLVWQPWMEVASVYGAYSTSFEPLVGSGRLGDPFEPERGEACEAGLKWQLLDQQLGVTLAGFRTIRSNVLVPDPVDPDYSLQLGRADSQGVELDVVGNLTERWQLLANAAYIDARVSRDTDAQLEGNRLPNVPYCSAAFWTRYDLIRDCCQNLGVTLGMTYVGHRAGDPDNSYLLPSYTRWDAGLVAARGPIRLSLYAENLFDAWYITSSRNAQRNLPGAPFQLRGMASLAY
jgi:iron complex outermembrane receptor protein